MDLDLIGVTAASISAIRQCGPDRAVDRPRGISAATQMLLARAAAGVHRATMSAPSQFSSSSFSVLGGLAPRLSSAAVVCKKEYFL
jgi:hypothetical protein